MKNISFVLFVMISLLGCNKTKPKIGEYEAIFSGSYDKNGQIYDFNRFQEFKIVEVNEKEIKLSIYTDGSVSSILKKDGKVISGIFKMLGQGGTGGPNYASNDIYITGFWEKKKGKFYISGFHQFIYTEVNTQNQEINEYVVSGNFEIIAKD
jgi:hypothetical protein